ncbi:hypothetical protein E2C01_077524 [Portunus trituberculatus]|uniref:Uncharacterized protein n=1 Tax=Portunus trituberculatus TaxID=210409 RepID=A0A5B7IMB7_PORTR|nr:hypothetical protein [Portunus trituberculatus]
MEERKTARSWVVGSYLAGFQVACVTQEVRRSQTGRTQAPRTVGRETTTAPNQEPSGRHKGEDGATSPRLRLAAAPISRRVTRLALDSHE